jgi:hypothetical protein
MLLFSVSSLEKTRVVDGRREVRKDAREGLQVGDWQYAF